MNIFIFIMSFMFFFTHTSAAAEALFTTSAPQPMTCITSKFIVKGNQYSKLVTLQLTNNCKQAVDFENTSITFLTQTDFGREITPWGSFAPLPYPDMISLVSQPQPSGDNYLATLTLHLTAYPGASTQLPIGKSITISYTINSDTHIENSVKVYVGTMPDKVGSLQLINQTPKPENVAQNYALIHLTMNGDRIRDVVLPWNSTVVESNLSPGIYALSPDDIKVGTDTIYNGVAAPNAVKIGVNQRSSTTITYNQVKQQGMVTLHVQNTPQELPGYSKNPVISLKEMSTSSIRNEHIKWGQTKAIQNLNVNSSYSLSTNNINYNGYVCVPRFDKTIVQASSAAPPVNLSYKCTQMAEAEVTLKVSGAPKCIDLLSISLIPNNQTEVITTKINLANGNGVQTLRLPMGVIYKLATKLISGYVIQYSPNQLTVVDGAVVNIKIIANTPVALNGQLHVCGTQLCNQQNKPIQLKGMSTHGLQWFGEGKCLTPSSLDFLANNFQASVIRLAMYVQEGGYETNPAKFTAQINRLIDEASSLGIYVLVDWHILNPGDPNVNLALAKQFFTEIARTNKDRNNILYEIANEPHGVSWASIKSYANEIIPVIRAIDSNAPIIVGTRGYSTLGLAEGSNYREVANNPIDFPNIMYTVHFYASSRSEKSIEALDNASDILPIFVTEFGTSSTTREGGNEFAMTDKYMAVMARKKIGWANWNYADANDPWAIWERGTCANQAWSETNLRPNGIYIREKIKTP